jgi:radical SAM superfamily enzyme YgiQ (UPF0313 family)
LFYPKNDEKNATKFLPLSILKIASQLKSAGFDVISIDERLEGNYKNKLIGYLDKAICVGVSVMTGYQIRGGLEASSLVKKVNNGVPVVWGGWHPSLLPEETLENENIDIVVKGQGEITICELAKALKDKKGLADIQGILFKKDKKVIANKSREFNDINSFYPVRYDVLEIDRYITKSPIGERSIFWSSSQGCPYPCGFCCTPAVYCRKWSGLSPEALLGQLKKIIGDYKVDSVIFAEDNFLVDVKRIEKLCRGIIENNLKFKWATDVRIDKVNRFSDEFVGLLKASGCFKLFVGAESGDQDTLDLIDKKIRLEDTYKMAEKLDKHKIISEFFLMVGFPKNPSKDLERTLELIKKVKEPYPDHQFTAFLYTPYPGTPLMPLAVKHGLKIPEKLEDWVGWNVLSVHTPWVDKKYLDKVNRYTKCFYPLAFPSVSLKARFNRKIRGFPYRVLHAIARFRVKNNFFYFPLEWKLLKFFHALQMKFNLFAGVESFR